MALSFFHGDQLVRGAAAAEEIEPAAAFSSSRPGSDERGGKAQRLPSHTIRRLQSETALSARARADEASFARHSSYGREDKGKEPVRPVSRSRPATSTSYHSYASDSLPVEVSRGRPLAILGVRKPSFLMNVLPGASTKYSRAETERPRPSGNPDSSWRRKEPFKARLHEELFIDQRASLQAAEAAAAKERPDASTRTYAGHGNIRTAVGEGGGGGGGIRTSQLVKQNPPRLFMPPKDTIEPGQFLAEALAHVIVGEWMYKDRHKPGLMPQANILQRHFGPPPRGSTGLPQKRWFRIDPYERLLTWSSKWDSAASAQHKARRRVPINLVFEVPNRIVFDGCIPPHAIPHNESIVVIAPLQVLKITAPDETRHALWMTALQYLVDSKRMPAHVWPDVLAARLSPLSVGGAAARGAAGAGAAGLGKSRWPSYEASAPVQTTAAEAVTSGDPCKPLPPTPPTSGRADAATAAEAAGGLLQARGHTSSTIMTPPAVPRYSHHAHRDSDGELSIRRSDMSGTSPSPPSVRASNSRTKGDDDGQKNRGNDDDAAADDDDNDNNNNNAENKDSNMGHNGNHHKSFPSEQADMYASSSERQAPASTAEKVRLLQQQQQRRQQSQSLSRQSRSHHSHSPHRPHRQQQDDEAQEPGSERQLLQPYEHQHREHGPQEHDGATMTDHGSDDYEVDQMDELVAGLGNI